MHLLSAVVAKSKIARCIGRLHGSVLEKELLMNEQPCQNFEILLQAKALTRTPKCKACISLYRALCAFCKQLQGTKKCRQDQTSLPHSP